VIIDVKEASEQAALLKCQRALSLADYFTIVAGEIMNMKVMFARREKELESEVKRKPFEIAIIFASEVMS